jgi:hypothetical protein
MENIEVMDTYSYHQNYMRFRNAQFHCGYWGHKIKPLTLAIFSAFAPDI